MEQSDTVSGTPYWIGLPAIENALDVLVIRGDVQASTSVFHVYDRSALNEGNVVYYGFMRVTTSRTSAGNLYHFEAFSLYTHRKYASSNDGDCVAFLMRQRAEAEEERESA